MKVAITGASGHLGNNLINYLNSQDISVRILTHKNNVQNSGGQNLIYSGDILDTMRKNVKTTQEIDEYCDNFENNMKQKKLSFQQLWALNLN